MNVELSDRIVIKSLEKKITDVLLKDVILLCNDNF